MAYTNFTNCTQSEYTDIIYSQDDKNRIRIWFNNVELSDAGQYCESLSGTNRVLPNDGGKRFTIGNFISKEYTLILRDLPVATVIADQVRISIGTLVDSDNDTWEDVPIGIFNIQDTPQTDKNKVTIKLRDNRIKFDFGYNAQPLIEQQGGAATLGQILSDICTQAGVINDVSSFAGDSISVAIYDNSIKATNYVSYIAEQAGAIPIITREGHLNFIYLNNLSTWRIPLSIVEKYEIGTPFTIERVVYESGIIKYETSNDDTKETLYLDAANMYINSLAQVISVFNVVENFELDSATTGKVLGNPAIDPYDLIEIYDDDDTNEPTIFKTLANNTYTFNGVHRQTFDTQIGKEERTENVTISGEGAFKKTVKTEIDNIEATVSTIVSQSGDIRGIVLGNYTLTNDATFQANKTYYYLTNSGDYAVYTNYNVGDTIPADTIYELTGSIVEKIDNSNEDLQNQINANSDAIQTLNQTTTSRFDQTINSFEASFNTVTQTINDNQNSTNQKFDDIRNYLRYEEINGVGIVTLGTSGSEIVLRQRNDRVYFEQNGNEVAYISNNQLYITDAQFLNSIRVGNFAFIPRSNGSLGFRKVS